MMTHTHYSNLVFLCFFFRLAVVYRCIKTNSNNICPDCKRTDSRTSNTCLATPDGWQQCKFNIVVVIFIVVDSHPIVIVSVVWL